MTVSSTRYGIVVGLAAGAILLTGCGGSGGSKSDAAPAAPTNGTSNSAAPSDSGSAAPSDSSAPSDQPSGGTSGYSGPTVGPGHKCGTISVVAGSIQCSHAEKIYQLYASSKKPNGSAVFNGWTCLKETTGVVCSRSAIKLRSAA